MAMPFKCSFCGATDSVSKGVRKTKTMGVRRIRLCKACGRKFTPKDQKPGEARGLGSEEQEEKQLQEADEPTEPTAAPQEDAEAPAEPGATGSEGTSAESAGALARVFSPPDDEWTS